MLSFPALRHVKEPSTSVNYECAGKICCIVPSFASRGLSCLCGAWRLWWSMRVTHWGKGTIGLQAAVPKKPHKRPLTFLTLWVASYMEYSAGIIALSFCAQSGKQEKKGKMINRKRKAMYLEKKITVMKQYKKGTPRVCYSFHLHLSESTSELWRHRLLQLVRRKGILS